MKKTNKNFLLCVENRGCDDLERGKVYPVIPDLNAAEEAYVRVIDDSGENYLYPETYFVPIKVPAKAQEALAVPV